MDDIIDQTTFSSLALILSSSSLLIALAWALASPKMKRKVWRNVKYPDGPQSLPILGNIFFFSALRKRPDQELLRLARKYGEICMLWFGSNPVIVVSSPKLAKELMDKVSDQITHRLRSRL